MKTRLFLSCMIVLFAICSTGTLFAQATGAVQYLGHIIPPQGGSWVGGSWGWTDTTTGREYALLGCYCGTSIVEITNTSNLVERAFIPGVCSEWREIQTYQHYAYVVSEGGYGTQIIDLSYLPDSAHLVTNFIYTSGSKTTDRSHTDHITDGYLYLNGCADYSVGGIVIFSLANPVSPAYVGEWEVNYTHDCFVRHDTIYAAAIYGQGLQVIDATNKANPQLIYTISYSGAGTHNCATTTDGKYVMTTDEIGTTAKTLKFWDIHNPPTCPKVAEYVGDPAAIVHNVFVKGTLAIMSYYTAGMRVVDITNPTSPVELGGYDTYPGTDGGYYGAWSVYPFFPSGKITIGDMQSGLYVVALSLTGPKTASSFTAFSNYLTPSSVKLTWQDPTTYSNGTPLSNFHLKIYRNGNYVTQVDSGVQSFIDSGLALHQYYVYTAVVVSGTDTSIEATSGAYAGGNSTSNPPTAFTATPNINGVLLAWVNPSRQLDNTTLNDLAYVLIYRDGALLDSVSQTAADTGQARTYLDPVSGYHSYFLKVRDNETPRYYSQPTATMSSFGMATTLLREGFEGSISMYQHTGTWAVTTSFAADGTQSLTDSPLGDYTNNSVTYVVLSPVILGSKPMLRFKHAAIVAYEDFAFVDISKDQEKTFGILRAYDKELEPQWQDGVLNQDDWVTEQVDLSSFAHDTVYIRFRLFTNSNITDDGWYIDDVYIGPSSYDTTITMVPAANWNILSLPISVPDNRVSTLFPTATSSAFTFSGGYQASDSLQPGIGYWLKFDSSQTIPVEGNTAFRDTLVVNAKWNMIGSLTSPVSVASITSIPSDIIQTPFYGFNGGYEADTIITPGQGYWVKTSKAGRLIFSNFTKRGIQEGGAQALQNQLNTLTLRDAQGHSRTLYFGNSSSSLLDRFELPPVPPAGAFDARFSSQRSVGLVEEKQQVLHIDLQSISYPLTVEWNMQNQHQEAWALLTDRKPVSLTRQGSIKTTSQNLSLRFDGAISSVVPAEYSLGQNYPNPFNPATNFEFQIAKAGFVTLNVYNMLGEEVASLVNESKDAGTYSVQWDASAMPSGVYYYRLQSGTFSDMKKMLLLR